MAGVAGLREPPRRIFRSAATRSSCPTAARSLPSIGRRPPSVTMGRAHRDRRASARRGAGGVGEAAEAVGGDTVADHSGATAEGRARRHARVQPRRCRATPAGSGRSRWPARRGRGTPPSTRSCCCPARARCLRRLGAVGGAGPPGDLSPGDLLPPPADDPRVVPAYLLSDDPAVEDVGDRARPGPGAGDVPRRADATPRSAGTTATPARTARWPGRHRRHAGPAGSCCRWPARCAPGSASAATSVTATDGRVVSVAYGCGAHSEISVAAPLLAEPTGEVFDDGPRSSRPVD